MSFQSQTDFKKQKAGRVILTGFFCLGLVLFLMVGGWHCPIRFVTGVPCPGCGMTTALRSLLKMNLESSLYWNPMLVPTIIAFGILLFSLWTGRDKLARNTVIIWAALMVFVWVLRMILFFPDEPMLYVSDSLMARLIHSVQSLF